MVYFRRKYRPVIKKFHKDPDKIKLECIRYHCAAGSKYKICLTFFIFRREWDIEK